MRSPIFTALLLLALSGCAAPSTPVRTRESVPADIPGKIWMHVDGEWARPPANVDVPADYGTAPATLVRLESDHDFTLIECWVIRADGKLSISAGDPHRVSAGTWTESAAGAEATYRVVYELVQPAGGKYPGTEQKGAISFAPGVLRLGGRDYTPAPVDVAVFEQFARKTQDVR